MAAPAAIDPLSLGADVPRHGARGERRRGDQSGRRARPRPADGAHAPAAGGRRPHERRPRADDRSPACCRSTGLLLLWFGVESRSRHARRAGDARQLRARSTRRSSAAHRSPPSSARCRARCRRSSAGRPRAASLAALAPWTLFLIMFLWQLPHFLAIAWMYRDDYARAGLPMLPVIDRARRADGPPGGALGRDARAVQPAAVPVRHCRRRRTPSARSSWASCSSASPCEFAHPSHRTPTHGCSSTRSITYLPLLWILMASGADERAGSPSACIGRPLSDVRVDDLPHLNAALNATSAVLLVDRLVPDQGAPDRGAPRVHDGGVRRRRRCS